MSVLAPINQFFPKNIKFLSVNCKLLKIISKYLRVKPYGVDMCYTIDVIQARKSSHCHKAIWGKNQHFTSFKQ